MKENLELRHEEEICIPGDTRCKSFSGDSVVLQAALASAKLRCPLWTRSLLLHFLVSVCLSLCIPGFHRRQALFCPSHYSHTIYMYHQTRVSLVFWHPRGSGLLQPAVCTGKEVPPLPPGTFPSGTSPLTIFPESPEVSALMFLHVEVGLQLSFRVFHEEAKLWFQQGTVVRLFFEWKRNSPGIACRRYR